MTPRVVPPSESAACSGPSKAVLSLGVDSGAAANISPKNILHRSFAGEGLRGREAVFSASDGLIRYWGRWKIWSVARRALHVMR